MQRKVEFIPGEYYHVYSRGVEKRNIFMDIGDRDRFMALLYIMNQERAFRPSDYLKRGQNVIVLYNLSRSEPITSILAYAQMNNHFHLLIQERIKGGISKFMGKLLTAYSMYFNTKYKRSGPLFIKPFRSVHVDDDTHFRHLFAYIHTNPLSLEDSPRDDRERESFIRNYGYSSYSDLFDGPNRRLEAKILDYEAIPDFINRKEINIDELARWANSNHEGSPRDKVVYD
jgi:putative transposase